MKKTRLLLLTVLLAFCVCATAAAASLVGTSGPSGSLPIASVTDAKGYVTTLTDGDTTTSWTREAYAAAYATDLTINLYSASVGEIWIRNGHCYSQSYYDHYDRADVIAVTLWYTSGRTSTSVTYRYRMSDSFRPTASSSGWQGGYQRLLLPTRVDGVTKIDLKIESVKQGYGRTGVTLTDIAVTRGSHATATPRRSTATPRPYVSYITPTPSPLVEYITPAPTKDVSFITPIISRPPTAPPSSGSFPSKGVPATLTRAMATRTGPGTEYDEPGTFFNAGEVVNVLTRVWDENNMLYWLQVEFYDGKVWRRAYTTQNYVSIDVNLVPNETTAPERYVMTKRSNAYFGPGTIYGYQIGSPLPVDTRVKVYAREDGWALVEYYDWGLETTRRAWVDASNMARRTD